MAIGLHPIGADFVSSAAHDGAYLELDGFGRDDERAREHQHGREQREVP